MRIFPLGDSAATVEFGNEISSELNERAIELSRYLQADPFVGMVEAVPACASVTVFYNHSLATFAAVKNILSRSLSAATAAKRVDSALVEIPIHISTDASPDLGRIADLSQLPTEESLDLFLSRTYRVYMLGFLPGFAYMGEVDDRIAVPRLGTPRMNVPKGSVGIAGKQTGIYSLESPGGWNIIGRTDVQMFESSSDAPCLLKPGDEVRFLRF